MKTIPRVIGSVLAGATLLGWLHTALPTVGAEPSLTNRVSFEAVNTSAGPASGAILSNYLAQFGITIAEVSSGIGWTSEVVVVRVSSYITASSPGSFLSIRVASGFDLGGQRSFTLRFDRPLQRFSFTRPLFDATFTPGAYSDWSAHALLAGTVIDSVGEPGCSGLACPWVVQPPQRFTLEGLGIQAVRFVCYGSDPTGQFVDPVSLAVDDLELVQPPVITPTTNRVDFDALNTSTGWVSGSILTTYLSGYEITAEDLRSDSQLVVSASTGSYTASSPSNFLSIATADSGDVPVRFTLRFGRPVNRFRFTRIQMDPLGSDDPQWTARALNAAGAEIASAGEPGCTNVICPFEPYPARTFTLNGPGIAAVRFDAYGTQPLDFIVGNVTLAIDDLELVFAAPIVAPTVSIVSPANGQTYFLPTNITLTAEASDPDGSIAAVYFFESRAGRLGVATNSPYSFIWSNVTVGTYQLTALAIDNSGGATTSSPVNVTVGGPVITQQPVARTVTVGANVTFSVAATGPVPLTYQWLLYHNAIPGATNTTLRLDNVQLADAGDYSVVINPGGILSQNAALTVVPAPSFELAGSPRGDFWQPDGPVYAILETNGIIYLGGSFQNLLPPTSQGAWLDVFSARVDPAFPKIDGSVFAAIPDGQGGWFIGGEFFSVGGVPRTNLVHILNDKTIDPDWKPAPNAAVRALALADGVLYFGGNFTAVGPLSRSAAAAVDAGSGLPTAWNPDIHTSLDLNPAAVYALAVNDAMVFIGGNFAAVLGVNKMPGGPGLYMEVLEDPWSNIGNVYALAVVGDTLILGGRFDRVNAVPRQNLAAISIAARQVRPWNPAPNDIVQCLGDFCNTLIVGGSFTAISGQTRNRLAALDLTAGAATSWNPNASGPVSALAVSGNMIYAAGGFTRIANQTRTYLAALDGLTGQIDDWAPFSESSVGAVAVSGGRVFAGVQERSRIQRRNLAALDAASGQPIGWNPNASAVVYALAGNANTIYAGGNFASVQGQSRSSLAAIDAATGNLTSWNPVANAVVRTLGLEDNLVYAGGAFTGINGQPRSHLAAMDATTGSLSAWNPNLEFGFINFGSSYIDALLTTPELVYVAAGGGFGIGGQWRNTLGAVDRLTGAVTSWNPIQSDDSFGSYATTLLLSGNRLYAGGHFQGLSLADYYLLAFDTFTGNAFSWNPAPQSRTGLGLDVSINALALSGNTIYVGGDFASIRGQLRNNLAAVDYISGSAKSWNPGANGSVVSLAASEHGLAAGGWFTTLGGVRQPYFAFFPLRGSPVIIRQPVGQTIPLGQTATFNVETSADSPLTFQWQFNGVDIPGAISPALVLPNVQRNDAGAYSVVVRNQLGEVRSAAAVLVVAEPIVIATQPAGQTVAPGSNVTLSVAATGSPAPNYQWRLNGVNIPGAVFSMLALTNVQPTNSGNYTVVVFNGRDSVERAVAELIVTAPALPFADDFADRVSTNSLSGVGSGSNVGATREPGEPFHADKRSGASVWLSWRAPASGIAVFHTRGSSFDTLLAIYTNSVVHQTNVLASDDDRGGFLTSLVSFNARAGTEYQIAIDGFNSATGRVVLSWNLELTTDELPRIVLGPESQTVGPGGDVTFQVVALSATPQTYQWFFNCLPIPGATNVTLEVPNVQAPRVGLYSVQVSNAVRMVESLPAILQINFTGGEVANVAARDKLADLLPLTAASSGIFVSVAQGTTGFQIFNNTGGGPEPGEPLHCGVIGGASYWLQVRTATNFQTINDGILTVSTDGSDFDTVLSVYEWAGTTLEGLRLVGCDDNSGRDGEDSMLRLRIPAEAGAIYWIGVDGVNARVGNVTLNYALDIPSQLTSLARTVNGFEMYHQAALGRRYAVEASTNLNRWATLMTTNLSGSAFWYLDTNATKFPQRFYRVVPSP